VSRVLTLDLIFFFLSVMSLSWSLWNNPLPGVKGRQSQRESDGNKSENESEIRVRNRERVCVCVRERERESQSQRERERGPERLG